MYAGMLRVRMFEERVRELFANGRIPGFLHTSVGQEAIAIGSPYGLDQTVGRPNQSLPAPKAGDASKFAVTKGRGCYTLELELRFRYMDPEMKFMPGVGKTIGFTAAINDWDYRQQADGGRTPERQSHVFSKNPGDQYWVNADSFGTLTLGPPR